ncbi:hypothetical protein Q5H91_06080 [Sphingomonas sp. KR1UV-12]|uniref:Uncharacterized protein n=1 Tax=Sphingomonas aurea TaxID=3063994 RepID=A0ABT9EII5_9SPHN|nr:hypothetical protein [Sphingomonas sp. KR1UV-12]
MREALVYAYRRWAGEKRLLDEQISKIEAAQLTLEEKRRRAAECDKLIESADNILAEIWDGWDPAKAKPAQRYEGTLPFEHGDVTRWTLDIMRRAPDPMRALHIAKQLVTEQGRDVTDKAFVREVGRAVDGTLRSMAKRNYVEKTDDTPVRWRIVGRAGDETA